MARVPSLKVLPPTAFFFFVTLMTRPENIAEIGSKYGPFDIAMLPIWRGGPLLHRPPRLPLAFLTLPQHVPPYAFSSPPRPPTQLTHTPDSFLTAYHATPAQALRARHSLAMHFATFTGSDVEALDPIVELEQAKREMGADLRHGSEGEGGGEGEEA